MAVNLPPHYHDADARYKKAQTPEDKLVALQGNVGAAAQAQGEREGPGRTQDEDFSELTDQIEQAKSGPKKAAPGTFKFPRQGAGQVVFVGPPNAGKSLLMTKLTKAKPEVAPYPFTTREPVPGMMDYEDVRVQLIDLPPITADNYETFVTDITRAADAAVLFLDLADDDGPAATYAVIDRLKVARRELVPPGSPPTDDPTTYAVPTLLVANKGDDEAADIRLEIAREEFGTQFPVHVISAERGDGLDALRKATLRRARRDADLHEAAGQARGHDQPVHPADRRDGGGTGRQGSHATSKTP